MHSQKLYRLTYFVLVFVLFSINIFAQDPVYYVDPKLGNDSNPGTIAQPFLSITKAYSALSSKIGTIYLRGGDYILSAKLVFSRSGLQNNAIKIWSYKNEKPVLDFSAYSSDGISISGSYYHFKGIEIKKAGHSAINISGHYNIIENCSMHDCKNTGLTMGSSSSTDNPSNNLIINCDSYNNYDQSTHGENADGFSAKWNVGSGNVFKKCRSWNNSDDGWDLWMGTGTITMDSCIAFRNGINKWSDSNFQGDGNGFKLGGNYVPCHQVVKNCLSYDNQATGNGFDENNNTAGQTLYNCTAFRNKGSNYKFSNTVVSGSHDIKNCISYEGTVNITSGEQIKNTWNGFSISANDFMSTDTTNSTVARDAAGNLPTSNFLRLKSTSSLINTGINVGIPYYGSAPDLGAFEFNPTTETNREPSNPTDFELNQNYPNPFNPSTVITYRLAVAGNVSLKIYDAAGKEVDTPVNKFQQAGIYNFTFSTRRFSLSSGVYFYKLVVGNFSQTRKMIVMK